MTSGQPLTSQDYSLDAEINELQRENARVESQMLKLKTNIHAMETHLKNGDKMDHSEELTSSDHALLGNTGVATLGNNVHEYYQNLHHNMMSLLENSPHTTSSHNVYLSKLHSLCGGSNNNNSVDYYNLNLKNKLAQS